jgi:hypothetical protein
MKTGETEGKGKNTHVYVHVCVCMYVHVCLCMYMYPRTHTESSVGLILSREWKEPVHEVIKRATPTCHVEGWIIPRTVGLTIAPIG